MWWWKLGSRDRRSGVQGQLLLYSEFEISLVCIRAEKRRKEERGEKEKGEDRRERREGRREERGGK